MFGYIKKDELLKKLREEMDLQDKIARTYRHLASDHLERKLAARTESDREWYERERYKYATWAEETTWKYCEAVTIYNMVKQM